MRCPRVRPRTQAESPGGDGAPLAGTRTCRQELADRRGWSTFSKAWPVRRNDTAVARREAPACFERNMRPGYQVSRPLARHTLGSLAGERLPEPLLAGEGLPEPLLAGGEGEGRLTRGRSNNTGDNPWLFDIRIEEGTAHPHSPLIPAKAGIQLCGSALGPRFRGDERGREAAGEVTISRPSS